MLRIPAGAFHKPLHKLCAPAGSNEREKTYLDMFGFRASVTILRREVVEIRPKAARMPLPPVRYYELPRIGAKQCRLAGTRRVRNRPQSSRSSQQRNTPKPVYLDTSLAAAT